MYQLLCTNYHVPTTTYQLLRTNYYVPTTTYQLLCTNYYIPTTMYQLLCTNYYVPTTMYQLLCTNYYVPTTTYQLLCTNYYVPTTTYQLTLTLSCLPMAVKVGVKGSKLLRDICVCFHTLWQLHNVCCIIGNSLISWWNYLITWQFQIRECMYYYSSKTHGSLDWRPWLI